MIHHQVVQRRVEFSETDMAGIVHFSNYFKWMESAEAELFRQCGAEMIERFPDHFVGWPRVRAKADFSVPVRFQDVIEIHLFIKELHAQAIRYFFRFYKVEGERRIAVGKGEMTTVHATLSRDNNMMESASLPENLLAKLEEAPAEAMKKEA